MANKQTLRIMIPIYFLILFSVPILTYWGSYTVSVIAENKTPVQHKTLIIDAGHGGVDGGATSCTGIRESEINLQIASKLNDLFHLIGFRTIMVRTGDYSIHKTGNSISQIKISDLKERVKLVNETENAILLSIHQNYYPEGRYHGAQVFYADTYGSADLAECLQKGFRILDPKNNRMSKKADGIYLMQNVHCTGILVECGFLSNPKEESLLRSNDYQNQLCAVIASVCSTYLHEKAVKFS